MKLSGLLFVVSMFGAKTLAIHAPESSASAHELETASESSLELHLNEKAVEEHKRWWMTYGGRHRLQ